jgi:four helix bundle protein
LGIARGSLFEVETMLVIGGRQNLLDAAKLSVLIALIHEVGRLITALMHSLEERLRRAK